MPGAFIIIISNKATNAKLPLTSEEPGLHAGTSQGTGARLVPDLHPVATGFGQGDLKPVASPHTSSPSHQQLFQGNPHLSCNALGTASTAF